MLPFVVALLPEQLDSLAGRQLLSRLLVKHEICYARLDGGERRGTVEHLGVAPARLTKEHRLKQDASRIDQHDRDDCCSYALHDSMLGLVSRTVRGPRAA